MIESDDTELFEGDVGTLPLSARKALNYLMGKPIYKSQNPELWSAVYLHKKELQIMSNNNSVKLIVDEVKHEAYLKKIDDETYSICPLRSIQLNFYECILWTWLSDIYNQEDEKGGVAYVYKSDLDQYMDRFKDVENCNEDKHRKIIEASIHKAVNSGVLTVKKTALDGNRYRINSLIKKIMNLDQVETIKKALKDKLKLAQDMPKGD